ncbi:alkaline phosphatase [Bacteroidia bacterium]|nr:alkaline phosphatase [Bacteroidia bacterium]
MMQTKKSCLLALIAATVFASSLSANEELPPQKDESITERVVSWYMEHMNYGTVTLLMAVESSFIPFPSEVVVPPAAYKAREEGSSMNVVGVVLFATLGALIGSIFNYFLALWLGRPVIYRFAESRLGRMCLLSKEKVVKAEDYFVKHGKASTFIGRLVTVVRQLISLPAGLARMHFGTFILYTTLGAGLWNIILAVVGYVAYGNADIINSYSRELSYVLVGLGILFVGYLFYNGFIKKRT